MIYLRHIRAIIPHRFPKKISNGIIFCSAHGYNGSTRRTAVFWWNFILLFENNGFMVKYYCLLSIMLRLCSVCSYRSGSEKLVIVPRETNSSVRMFWNRFFLFGLYRRTITNEHPFELPLMFHVKQNFRRKYRWLFIHSRICLT